MNLRKICVTLFIVLFSVFSIQSTFAGKYDALVEKVVMKKEESKRMAFISKLEKAISAYITKIKSKSNPSKKDKTMLALLPELEKSVASVKTKLFPEDKNTDKDDKKDENNTDKDDKKDNTENKTDDKKDLKSHNASGMYYRSDLVKSYMEDYNKLNGSVKERREVYIKDAMERNGYSREYAEGLADLYIGKALTPVEDGVMTFKLDIDTKKTIKGKECKKEQKWNSSGDGVELKTVCNENNIVKTEFNYDPWLSSLLGYDVYGEETANHLQINRYLIDYKKGVIVYAEYATHPMNVESDYFKSYTYTIDVKDAKNFDEDMYNDLIKKWNDMVKGKKDPNREF